MLKLAIYLKNYKKECVIGPIFKFLEVIFELLLPTVMAQIINVGVANRDFGYVLRMGGVMVVMTLLGYGCAFICQRLAARASQGFGTTLRNAVFERVLAFSYTQVDQFGAPTLTNRITSDINQLQVWVAMMIRLVARAPFICIGSIIMSFFLDYRLALFLLAATPILAGIIYFITKFAAPLYRTYQQRLDKLAVVVRENLTGVRVIRAFSKEQAETRRFYEANDNLLDTGYSIGWASSFFNPLTSLTVNLLILIILWVSGLHIQVGQLSQGQIIAFINYVNQLLLALLVVSNLIILLTKSMASAVRINEILDTQPDMEAPASLVAASANAAPAVEFSGVTFGYNDTGDRVLEDISFQIAQGETIGIIGGTGSGKSTLINLIARFYDVQQGQVLVQGIPVKNYPFTELRKKIGMVPQRALLFTGTVAENIRWGSADATMEQVQKAAQTAQAAEFIATLPEGYDTMVRRGGTNLSGGQRQRLTIARALVGKPEILILDDASSALDFLTDARLRQAIRETGGGATVLLVSQRVGVVRDADRIIVLDEGKIAGIGAHSELYHSCETYREICLSQLSSEEAGA